ncbi:MAG: ATP-binding protein [Candidatus Promineifilaceae bacterium]
MLAQKDHIIENAGDQVAGDKYIVEKINDGYAAIGRGARLIVKNAISYAEEKQELKQLEQAQLARSVAKLAQSLESQAKPFAVRERNPYKNIDYYDISDAGRFYGRQEIRDQLLANLICSNSRCRLVVLHGEVGFGKTSLLRAGVMPLLVANGHLPLFVRVTTSSLTKSIMKSLFPEITETTDLKNASLQSFLRQVATILGPEKGIFILLDQFEHFFDASEEQRSEFLKELDDCLNDPTTGTSWLICVRSSRLGYLNVFQQIDRQPSTNSAVLGPLARNDARQAVNKPAQDAGFSVETELSEVLLDDLGGEIIEPVSLQIVCHTLVELLPDEEKKLTLQHYTEAGRAGGILRNYLDLILEHNLVEEDRDKGWKVLDAVDDLGPAKTTIV